MRQSAFVIGNMDCPTEEALIRKRLGSVPDIGELSFNLMTRRLTVSHSLDDERSIRDALREIGMNAVPAVTAERADDPDGENEQPVVSRRTRVLMVVTGISAIAAEITAWISDNEQSVAVASRQPMSP